ncbi:MAG: M13 family metallopeptidase [Lachnospiraceae bacterium]|nr:M13 family metallopeptidase [Lachnospiraceae bacterium]
MGKTGRRIRAIITALAAAASLTACAVLPQGGGGGQQSQGGSAAKPAQWRNSDLKSVMEESGDVTEKDDFALAVNREWSLANSVPDGYSSYDPFVARNFEVNDELKALMTDRTPYSDADAEQARQNTQNYYDLWMDWETRDELGMKPLLDLLGPLFEVETLDEMTEYLSDEKTACNATELAQCYASSDWNDTDHYAVYIDRMDVIFKDTMFYQSMDYDSWQQEPYYNILIRHILERMGYSEDEATKILADGFRFEKDVAEYCMTLEELSAEDAVKKQNNIRTAEELEELAGDFPIMGIIDANETEGSDRYILCEPDWLEAMGTLYTEENLERIRSYLIIYTAQDYAQLLDRETYELYGDVLNGINGASGRISDEEAAVGMVGRFLPGQLGRIYSERYVKQETVEEVTALAKQILDEYRSMLQKEEFLSEETREEAVRKLDNIRLHIAMPQVWEDMSALHVSGPADGSNLFKAQDEMGSFLLARQKTYINGTVNHQYWTSSPQDINAYYNPRENTVTICAGILGGDFYNTEMTKEELMASVGCTAAHEISHAFDSSGCHFDEKGNLRDWWSPEDYTAFRGRADKLVEYYDAIEPFPSVHCSGVLVQAEAIADLVGMKTMLKLAEKEKDFDYDRFFRSYAQTWKMISSEQNEYYSIIQDNHPLAYLRVNAVVQQFPEFYETFDIKEGDGMYLAPEDRLAVW